MTLGMWNRFSASSIRTKLALVMTLLVGVISMVIFVYFPERLRQQAVAAKIEQAYSVTDMAAFAVVPGLRAGHRRSVYEALWTLRENTDLVYIVVLDAKRDPFGDYNGNLAVQYRFDQLTTPESLASARRGRTNRTLVTFAADGSILQTKTPVLHEGQPVGYLFLGLSLTDLKSEIARSQQTIALVSLIIFIFGVVAAFGLSTVITGPLSRIVETVEQIAAGDLSRRAEVVHPDEVGQLATSFNTMVQRLESAHRELEQFSHGLEQRVEERTRELREEMSERQKAEAAKRLSEERYRLLFERNLAGVYIKTLDGKVLGCNDACARMFGYGSAEEFLGQGGTISYFDPADERLLLENLLEKGSVTNYEVRLRTQNGEVIWALENITLSPSADYPGLLEGILLDISDRKRSEAEIEYRAYHDSLTGLPNRVLFKDRLTVALARARRNSSNLAVMFLDLDELKSVNDMLGHPAGDQLLGSVGERLTQSLRQEDTVGRVGGDEFMILLPEIKTESDVETVARKVLEAFAEPFMLGQDEVHVTTSIGIAVYPADGEDPDTLLASADSTMYRVKETGGNAFEFCSRATSHRGFGRLTLEQNLKQALEQQQFVVFYQPQVNLETREITGVEALVRWRHPDGFIVEPGVFIALAEYTGLIIPIGEWVLNEACRQAREWHMNGFPGLRVGVNLSARQFHQRDFTGMIRRVLAETRIAPELLELEITESIAVHKSDWTLTLLHTLKEMGVSIAMDDFGTGQSSLSYLKRFPIDTVKIDQSFVRDIEREDGGAAIVRALLLLCNSVGKRTVAEGVETREQWDFLQRHRCLEAQGYFISRPVPPSMVPGLHVPLFQSV